MIASLVRRAVSIGGRGLSLVGYSSHNATESFLAVSHLPNSWLLLDRRPLAVVVRRLATMPDDQLNKRLDSFQALFVEARLCIEDVVDAAETTYFDDDAKAAKEAVSAAVDEFNAILKDINDADQKNRVLRSNGLKVEQLKGELEMALSGGHQ